VKTAITEIYPWNPKNNGHPLDYVFHISMTLDTVILKVNVKSTLGICTSMQHTVYGTKLRTCLSTRPKLFFVIVVWCSFIAVIYLLLQSWSHCLSYFAESEIRFH